MRQPKSQSPPKYDTAELMVLWDQRRPSGGRKPKSKKVTRLPLTTFPQMLENCLNNTNPQKRGIPTTQNSKSNTDPHTQINLKNFVAQPNKPPVNLPDTERQIEIKSLKRIEIHQLLCAKSSPLEFNPILLGRLTLPCPQCSSIRRVSQVCTICNNKKTSGCT